MRFLRQLGIVAALLLSSLPALADDLIANIVSPMASYQYSEDVISALSTNGGLVSPSVSFHYAEDANSYLLTNCIFSQFVSFQYLQNLGGELLTDGCTTSPFTSYQYLENLNLEALSNGNLISPFVSYFYNYLATSTLSTLSVSSGSMPADGVSSVTATVTLRDASNLPVAGKAIIFTTEGSPAPCRPKTSTTDANGQATTTIIATSPGTATVVAIDSTDGIPIQQTAKITFTSGSVLPGNDLSNAIVQLGNNAIAALAPTLANIAVHEGQCGDYFHQQISSDQINQSTIALKASIGGILPLVSGADGAMEAAAESLRNDALTDVGADGFQTWWEILVGDNAGASTLGRSFANRITAMAGNVSQYEQSLLAGVPPASANFVAAFTNDLQLRMQANQVLKTVAVNQDGLLIVLQNVAEFNHADFNNGLFEAVNAAGAVLGTMTTGPGAVIIDEGLNAGEAIYEAKVNQDNLNADKQSYNTALTSLTSCLQLADLIYSNTAAAFGAIAQGRAPNPATGQILGVASQLRGPQYNLNSLWLADPFAATLITGQRVTSGMSFVTITNTSPQSALFVVYALYQHTVSLTDFGVTVASAPYPLWLVASTNLAAGQSSQVALNYFDSTASGAKGALPDLGSQATIFVLACNGTAKQNIFKVGQTASAFQWVPNNVSAISSYARFNGKDETTGTFTFEDPIKCYVTANSSNQTYQAEISVGNPFAVPLQATVSQPLPAGITILNTDGLLGGGFIVWSNTIPTNGIVTHTFIFNLPVAPGAQTNLPAPMLTFADATGTNTLALSAYAPSFNGLLPMQVAGIIPAGVAGFDVTMPVTITNDAAANQSGTLTISLADANGNTATNLIQPFSLAGNSGTVLNFIFPGTLPPGSYLLTGQLVVNGDTETVLSGLYVVTAPPLMLAASATPIFSANGFNLALQGLINSNYLLEASTDLVNWMPILYLTATNSPFLFNDPSATNFSQRFYRASAP